MRWQIRRGVSPAPNTDRPGSPWWRAVNEGLLADTWEADRLGSGAPGEASRPSVACWVSFLRRPTGRSWYRAHNARVVAGYVAYRDLAHDEHPLERFFMDVALVRVLFAECMLSDPRTVLGRFAAVGRPLADPRWRGADVFLSLHNILPDAVSARRPDDPRDPRLRELPRAPRRLRRDPSSRPCRLRTCCVALNTPQLLDMLRDGSPVYAWPYDEREVWTTKRAPLAMRTVRKLTSDFAFTRPRRADPEKHVAVSGSMGPCPPRNVTLRKSHAVLRVLVRPCARIRRRLGRANVTIPGSSGSRTRRSSSSKPHGRTPAVSVAPRSRGAHRALDVSGLPRRYVRAPVPSHARARHGNRRPRRLTSIGSRRTSRGSAGGSGSMHRVFGDIVSDNPPYAAAGWLADASSEQQARAWASGSLGDGRGSRCLLSTSSRSWGPRLAVVPFDPTLARARALRAVPAVGRSQRSGCRCGVRSGCRWLRSQPAVRSPSVGPALARGDA